MKLYPLNKTVLTLKNNVQKLLQGIASNTATAAHSAFTDIAGRTIATFDQLQINSDEWLIVIEATLFNPVMEHLQKYSRLSKTQIQLKSMHAYFNLDTDLSPQEPTQYILTQPAGQLLLSEEAQPATATEQEFTWFRLKNNLPLQEVDYHNEMLLNIASAQEYVSFSKGCFLGQEVLSRVHFKSKPPKKLHPVQQSNYPASDHPQMTSCCPNPETGEIWCFFLDNNKNTPEN